MVWVGSVVCILCVVYNCNFHLLLYNFVQNLHVIRIKILNFHINRDIDGLFRLGLISPCSSTFQNRERSYENHINHERLYGRYLVNS
ncbi:hypothetical protein L2E82_22626 [Cichorium intybus]|uniref:Uncharacterized protein n=1 Tax=Cichorium intybus TaxID=13427 RepID=A0ACB9DXW2_CICIN|nr:hypothetical protein L2E82_22626 [Cichorium intybus]